MTTISLYKHVNFGEVILIVGDCHNVNWDIKNGIQMKWNQGDIWTVDFDCCFPLIYRYVVVKQQNRIIVEWEDGNNRVLNKKGIVNDIWGHLKVEVKLLSYKDQSQAFLNEYTQNGKTKIQMIKQSTSTGDVEFCHSFNIPNKQINSYAFKYQLNEKWERTGARHLINYPNINNVLQIIDIDPDFNINFHRITDNIFVGSYFYIDELHILEKLGIDAILNLQTVEDLINKDLPENYFQQLKHNCETKNIIYEQCPIKDCNKRSFLQKGKKAYEILKNLINDGKIVYVHCTDGIQRSIQTIILYLVQDNSYTLENAMELIKSVRERSKPNRDILQQLLAV